MALISNFFLFFGFEFFTIEMSSIFGLEFFWRLGGSERGPGGRVLGLTFSKYHIPLYELSILQVHSSLCFVVVNLYASLCSVVASVMYHLEGSCCILSGTHSLFVFPGGVTRVFYLSVFSLVLLLRNVVRPLLLLLSDLFCCIKIWTPWSISFNVIYFLLLKKH